MDVSLSTLTDLTSTIQAAESVSNSTNKSDEAQESAENILFDQVELSDSGRMLSIALRMAQEGNEEAQSFLSTLEDGLKSGDLDLDRLMANAPKELTSKMESEGIDLEEVLRTIVDFSAMVPSLSIAPAVEAEVETEIAQEVSGQETQAALSKEESSGNTEETSKAKEAGGAPSGGGSSSSNTVNQQIEQLEEQIEQLQQEIQQLSGKEDAEEIQIQMSAKQAELALAQATLATLESESSDA